MSAIAVRWWLGLLGDDVVPFALFFPIVLVCALFGGVGPGLLSLIISMAAVRFYWVEPGALFGFSTTSIVNLVIFTATCASIFAVSLFLRTTLRSLVASEARLAAMFEGVPAAIAAIDCDGRVVIANARFLDLFPSQTIPSRDAARLTRWSGCDDQGRPLAPEDLPGARALRGEFVVPGQDMIYTDDQGAAHWYRIANVPTRGSDGRVRGFVTAVTDISESKAIELALRESESRLQTLMQGIPQLVWRAAPGGGWTWASPQWEAMTGLSSEASCGEGWLEALHPEDRAAAHAAWQASEATAPLQFECRLQDVVIGEYRWFQTRALPVVDARGAISEWLGTCTDIHELHELQERHRVLVGELQHRTRNLMGVIGAMCDRTARSTRDFAEFHAKFHDRLGAMARAQGLLSRLDAHDRVTFDELVQTELTAIYGGERSGKLELSGPPGIRLRSSAVQTLAMALHELATNALKYGALRHAGARLEVGWRIERGAGDDDRDGEKWLRIDWRERGVRIDPDEARPPGQGRELIEKALPYQFGARTAYVLGADGVRCTIWIAVSREPRAQPAEAWPR